LQAAPQAVVAEGALPGPAVALALVDDPERAGGNAVPTPVAHVGLHDHRPELGPHQGAGGAHVEAGGGGAVLADVGAHQPAEVARSLPGPFGGALLLDEGNVAPGVGAQLAGVVVRAAEEREPVALKLAG